MARQRARVRGLLRIPDPLRAEFRGEVAAARLGLRQRRRALQFHRHHAHQRGHGLALGLQPGEHARDLRGLPVQRGIDQAEHVVARGFGDQLFHARGIERTAIVEQHELVDFLRRGEQVALHAFCEQSHRAGVGAQSARTQPPFQPVRQFVRAHFAHFDEMPDAGNRFAPLAAVLAAPRAGEHQQGHVRWRVRAELLDGLAAFLAGLAGGQVQFQQASRGKQAGRVDLRGEGVPVETARIDLEAFAFGTALFARDGTHRVGGFQHQQGFRARDQIGRAQRFAGEARRQCVRRYGHRASLRAWVAARIVPRAVPQAFQAQCPRAEPPRRRPCRSRATRRRCGA